MSAVLDRETSAPVPPPPSHDSRGDEGPTRGSGLLLAALASGAACVLAALSLVPVFATNDWLAISLLTIVIVTVVGAGATWARVPMFLIPIVQAVALFAVLIARFTVDAPYLVVPTPDGLDQLRDVLALGMNGVQSLSPPVPAQEGLHALAALGLGCVALVVFVLHVTMRMPVLAGAALGAVYVVPAMVLDDGAPWWSFGAVALAWLLLLASDERVGVASWGRRLTGRGADSSAWSSLTSAAVRIGALAVGVALLVPLLVPNLSDAVLGRHDTGTGPGEGADSANVSLSPFASLRQQLLQQSDAVMFTYETRTKPGYLRVSVADTYDQEQWREGTLDPTTSPAVQGAVPPLTQGLAAQGTQYDYVFTDKRLANKELPLPYGTSSVTVDGGSWFLNSTTGVVFSDAATTGQRTWAVVAGDVTPTIDQLRAAPSSGADALPAPARPLVPASVKTWAEQVTRGLNTDYDKALAIQDWLRTKFSYSVDVASNPESQGTSYIDQFLASRRGYCQQFAATMALMARAVNIESRVVIGYTAGDVGPDLITYTVRGRNAHAWPELYFSGVGWVPFDPTPTSDVPRTDPPYLQRQPTSESPSSAPSASVRPSSVPRPTKSLSALDRAGDASADSTVPATRLAGVLGVALLVALVALAPATVRWWRRRRRLRRDAEVEQMWAELRDTAVDLGLPWSDARTPRQTVAHVIAANRLRGEPAEAVTRLGRATEQARYGRTPPPTDGLADDVETARTALARRVEASRRLRALFAPPSLRRRDR